MILLEVVESLSFFFATIILLVQLRLFFRVFNYKPWSLSISSISNYDSLPFLCSPEEKCSSIKAKKGPYYERNSCLDIALEMVERWLRKSIEDD